MAVRSISVQLRGQGTARGSGSATLTLQVWDELWLLARLGPGVGGWVIGTVISWIALPHLWSSVVSLLWGLMSFEVHQGIARRLGPPRLRVLRHETTIRTRVRLGLSWIYRHMTAIKT